MARKKSRNSGKKSNFKDKKELNKAILEEKSKGTPDIEIGRKYGVTFRYIEKVITKSKGINVSSLKGKKKIKRLKPKNFEEEQTTVWSFRRRGNWATHSGEYRGNWSPYIPRNVIIKYSKPGETVLDYFCGAGTTAVEAKLLSRRCISYDINPQAIELAKRNIDFSVNEKPDLFSELESKTKIYEPKLSVADARDLSSINSSSIDLICAHPPYSNIIHYTDSEEGDLSFFDIDEFLDEMSKVAQESFRVLKPGRQCAILIGDMRRKKHVIPLGFKLIDVYLQQGFHLKELVIKRQHNCKTTGFWYANSIKYNFLLLAHEYLPIFEKPKSAKYSKDRKSGRYSITPVSKAEKLKKKRKLSELETTTVWIFPEKDYEKRLNKNVVDRYWSGHGYTTISILPKSKKESKTSSKKSNKKNSLIFLKSPFLKNELSHSSIQKHITEINNTIEIKLPDLTKGGFVVIQTKDIRTDSFVEPLAKRLIDTIKNEQLWLKEIVFIVKENHNNEVKKELDGHLKTTHEYLLVYEVRER